MAFSHNLFLYSPRPSAPDVLFSLPTVLLFFYTLVLISVSVVLDLCVSQRDECSCASNNVLAPLNRSLETYSQTAKREHGLNSTNLLIGGERENAVLQTAWK